MQLIFDKPGRQCFNPKQFEQSHRDTSKQSSKHVCILVTPHTNLPRSWSDYIDCRNCKRALIEALGLSLVQTGRFLLRSYQLLDVSPVMVRMMLLKSLVEKAL